MGRPPLHPSTPPTPHPSYPHSNFPYLLIHLLGHHFYTSDISILHPPPPPSPPSAPPYRVSLLFLHISFCNSSSTSISFLQFRFVFCSKGPLRLQRLRADSCLGAQGAQ